VPDVLPYISATPEETIFERCLLFRKMLCRYSSPGRRVVLCGDAAHAMHSVRGQGANMTFEDAHCLGLALEARGVGPQAVRLYERVRIPRANMVQWESNTYYKKQFEKNTSMEWKFKYVGPSTQPPSDCMTFTWYTTGW
jgi:2-polyprenyl-6-methoxyphenol hydroxylase-like FAD-dependent oxidoreductase